MTSSPKATPIEDDKSNVDILKELNFDTFQVQQKEAENYDNNMPSGSNVIDVQGPVINGVTCSDDDAQITSSGQNQLQDNWEKAKVEEIKNKVESQVTNKNSDSSVAGQVHIETEDEKEKEEDEESYEKELVVENCNKSMQMETDEKTNSPPQFPTPRQKKVHHAHQQQV